MNTFKSIIANNKGLTLLELTISILVGSIVIMSLMSLLIMGVNAKSDLEITNRLKTESYLINEEISSYIFDFQANSYEVTTTIIDDISNPSQTIIEFTRTKELDTSDGTPKIVNPTTPVSVRLVFDEDTGQITWDGNQLHSSSVKFLTPGTSLELIDITDPNTIITPGVSLTSSILKITLNITYLLPNGSEVDSQTFVTTIIV